MSSLKNHLISWFTQLLCRPSFFKLNQHFHHLSLRTIGVLNAHGNHLTGEDWLLNHLSINQMKTIIDVGANTQVYGIEQFPQAQFWAFEPNPETFQLLRTNTPKSKNIHLHQLAISSHSGTAKLYDFADDAPLKNTQPTATLASLNKSVIENFHGQKAKSYSVKTVTLDTFAQQQKIQHIDLLKIDVEGFELEVLKGAQRLLKTNAISLIQFEFNETHAYQRVFFKDFIDLLPNYTFYRLSPHGLLPLPPYRPLTHEIFAFQNILAISKDQTSDFLEKVLLSNHENTN